MEASDDRAIGVALSGGGHRAALFGLGVLVFLSDCGLNRRVGAISSVSGGSFTNAFVGCNLNYAGEDGDRTTFWSQAQVIAHRITTETMRLSHGIGFFSLAMFFWVSVVLIPTGGLLWFFFDAAPSGRWLWFLLLVPIEQSFHVPIVRRNRMRKEAALLLRGPDIRPAPASGSRRWLWFFDIYNRSIERIFAGDMTNIPKLDQLSKPTLHHIICATDLEAGNPEQGRHVYFTADGMESATYGSCAAPEVDVSTAVAASAAFPIAFRPVTIESRCLDCDRPPRVRNLKLADGGVHDNLGLPGLQAWAATTPGGDPWLIVVSSTPSTRFEKLGRLPLLSIARMWMVMHESNVASRIRSARNELFEQTSISGSVIQIEDSLHDVLRQAEERRFRPTRGRQISKKSIKQFVDFVQSQEWHNESTWSLSNEPESTWTDLAQVASGESTGIWRIDPDVSKRIMFHGYTLAMAHVFLFSPWLSHNELYTGHWRQLNDFDVA